MWLVDFALFLDLKTPPIATNSEWASSWKAIVLHRRAHLGFPAVPDAEWSHGSFGIPDGMWKWVCWARQYLAAPPPAFTEWVPPHLRGAPSTSKPTFNPTPSTTTVQPAPSTSDATSSPAPLASTVQPAITKSIINRRGLDLNSLAAQDNSTIQPNSLSTGEVLVEGANISTVPWRQSRST